MPIISYDTSTSAPDPLLQGGTDSNTMPAGAGAPSSDISDNLGTITGANNGQAAQSHSNPGSTGSYPPPDYLSTGSRANDASSDRNAPTGNGGNGVGPDEATPYRFHRRSQTSSPSLEHVEILSSVSSPTVESGLDARPMKPYTICASEIDSDSSVSTGTDSEEKEEDAKTGVVAMQVDLRLRGDSEESQTLQSLNPRGPQTQSSASVYQGGVISGAARGSASWNDACLIFVVILLALFI